MMTTHEVQTLLTIGENSVIEFKRAGDGPKWDTYESICAFLNRNGGDVLLLGSDDCIGCPLDDDYSPEKGHLQKRQTIQAGVRQTRQHGGFQECSDALRQTAVADNEPYNDTYKEPDNEPHNGETLTPSERKFLSFVEQAGSLSSAELRTLMCVRNVSDFHARYIRPMLKRGLIEHTLPNAKRSKFQKYRLTRRGHAVVENVLRSRKEVNQ